MNKRAKFHSSLLTNLYLKAKLIIPRTRSILSRVNMSQMKSFVSLKNLFNPLKYISAHLPDSLLMIA